MNCSRVLQGQSCPELNQRQNHGCLNLKNWFLPDVSSQRPENFFYLEYCPKIIGFQQNRPARSQTWDRGLNLLFDEQLLNWILRQTRLKTNSFSGVPMRTERFGKYCFPSKPTRKGLGRSNGYQITRSAMFEKSTSELSFHIFKDFASKCVKSRFDQIWVLEGSNGSRDGFYRQVTSNSCAWNVFWYFSDRNSLKIQPIGSERWTPYGVFPT